MQMYDGGFISLYRTILNWDWYNDKNTKILFIHLLLTANYLPGEWKGKKVGVGQRITSLAKISQELSMTQKEIRVALNHLKRTGEVACESTPQYTLITIKNYERYQRGASTTASNKANNRSNRWQTKGKRGANEGQQYNKGIKEERNNKEKNKKESGGIAGSPPEGDRLPAIGEGDCLLVIDGENHRFPASWYQLAEKKGVSIEDYVRWRHQ